MAQRYLKWGESWEMLLARLFTYPDVSRDPETAEMDSETAENLGHKSEPITPDRVECWDDAGHYPCRIRVKESRELAARNKQILDAAMLRVAGVDSAQIAGRSFARVKYRRRF